MYHSSVCFFSRYTRLDITDNIDASCDECADDDDDRGGNVQIEKLGIVKNGADSADSGDDSEPDNPDAPDAAYEQLEARILQGAAQNPDAAQEDDDVDPAPPVLHD